jgi:hypothetical protein
MECPNGRWQETYTIFLIQRRENAGKKTPVILKVKRGGE